jgi:hypothetical protein
MAAQELVIKRAWWWEPPHLCGGEERFSAGKAKFHRASGSRPFSTSTGGLRCLVACS